MIALGKHLRRHEDHRGGGFAFRRDCPICRDERLAGALRDDRIVAPAARVTFALGSLLAGGLMPPGVAVAERGGGSNEGVAIQAPPAPAPPARDTTPSNDLGAGAAPVADTSREIPRDREHARDGSRQPRDRDEPRRPPAPAPGADTAADTSEQDRGGRRDASSSRAEPPPASVPPAPAATPAPADPAPPPAPRGRDEGPQAGAGPVPPAPSLTAPASGPACASKLGESNKLAFECNRPRRALDADPSRRRPTGFRN